VVLKNYKVIRQDPNIRNNSTPIQIWALPIRYSVAMVEINECIYLTKIKIQWKFAARKSEDHTSLGFGY